MSEHIYHLQEQLFSAKTLYRELHQHTHEQARRGKILLFNDLLQLAQGNPHIDAKWAMQQINQSITWRREYIQLLQTLAFSSSPVQAAASTITTSNSRKSAEFELLFKRDPQFTGQVYVIVKIPHPTEKHHNQGVQINCCSEKLISRVQFGPIVDGKTQLLMEESEQDFINMFDAKFALYLS
mgnify:CR=1 FL=1